MTALRGQQSANMAKSLQMRHAHGLMPLDLADGQHGLALIVGGPKGHDVDLAGLLACGIVHRARLDAGWEAGDGLLWSEVPGPVPGELPEVAAEHIGRETGLTPLPKACGIPGVRQVGPYRAHHRVVEGDERLGDLVGCPVLAEGVRSPVNQAAVHEDVERMSQVARFPAYVTRDVSPGGVAVSDRGQHRVIEPHVVEFGFGRQQVAGFPEQRARRVQHRSLDPAVEVASSGRGIVPGEFAPVGRGTADDSVHLDGQRRIGDTPELGR
jgi:hypothetical protein